jgi:hypothetical protein
MAKTKQTNAYKAIGGEEKMSEPRATMTFEQSRKNLLAQMSLKAKGKTEDKIIHFRNDDVPKFLEALNEFEKKSKNNRIIVK